MLGSSLKMFNRSLKPFQEKFWAPTQMFSGSVMSDILRIVEGRVQDDLNLLFVIDMIWRPTVDSPDCPDLRGRSDQRFPTSNDSVD
jgi:hypothetical protein